MLNLGIIDYGAGNLSSVCNSFRAIGVEGRLVRTADDLQEITHLVLPGVGAFGDCSRALREQELVAPIREWIEKDKPFLGICIGYQILFDSSDETPGAEGLGIFRGHVQRFPAGELKIPHMGWNTVHPLNSDDPVWCGMGDAPHFYYVHSYFPVPKDNSLIAATSTYGVTYAAAIRKGRLLATQFHPEKSQVLGLRLLQNFLTL